MEAIITYTNYEEYKNTVDHVLNKTVEDFVTIGYLLKKGRDTDILKDSGYANVNEFAEAEYHLDASQVSRFIRINDKFAVDGYSDRLKEEYRGYGYAKLALMLTLPDELTEELSPAFSKTEIQAVKEEVEEETKVTDIEVILEGEKEEQRELNNLEKGLHQLFEDEPELFRTLYEQMQEEPALENIRDILVPNEEKTYSVRIQGFGRIMILLRDLKEKVTVFKVRSNEKEFYIWEDVENYAKSLLAEKPAKERWEELYGKSFPEKEEIAPVQPEKPKQRKESKVKKAKVPEKKPETKCQEPKKEEIAPVQEKQERKELKIEPKKEEQKPPVDLVNTKAEAKSEQVEGQTELTKDFPQFCPDSMNLPESPFKSRKEYIDGLTIEGAAVYMAKSMRTLPHFKMNFSDFWEKWLSEEVDENGEDIEVVE